MTLVQTVSLVMAKCRNYFVKTEYHGEITIEGETVTPDVGTPWVYVSGSRNNDGLHYMDDAESGLTDETFKGIIYGCNPPTAFIDLCKTIMEYDETSNANTPVSESFGNYSITRGASGGRVTAWQDAFSRELINWNRMFCDV